MFCGSILGSAGAVEPVGRHGATPAVLQAQNTETLLAAIRKDLSGFAKEGYASVGLITRIRAEAEQVFRALKEEYPLHLLRNGEEEFSSGVVVLPAYLSKGLEFDAVIVFNAGSGNYAEEDERLLLYIACTRALHDLHVYHIGALSPFLPKQTPI